jgi:hypothetical protein
VTSSAKSCSTRSSVDAPSAYQNSVYAKVAVSPSMVVAPVPASGHSPVACRVTHGVSSSSAADQAWTEMSWPAGGVTWTMERLLPSGASQAISAKSERSRIVSPSTSGSHSSMAVVGDVGSPSGISPSPRVELALGSGPSPRSSSPHPASQSASTVTAAAATVRRCAELRACPR